MCQSTCLEIFANAPETAERAAYINENAPDCRCEGKVVSPYCEHPVESSEILIRVIVDDTHIVREDDGSVRLRSTFMSDAMSFGASCLRHGRASKDEIRVTAEEILKNTALKPDGTPKSIIGYVLLSVNAVKSVKITQAEKVTNKPPIQVSGDAFGVYATGLPGRPNHSDVFINDRSKNTKFSRSAQNRSVRELGGKGSLIEIRDLPELIVLGV